MHTNNSKSSFSLTVIDMFRVESNRWIPVWVGVMVSLRTLGHKDILLSRERPNCGIERF